jgi:hypothetical protein
MIGHAPCLSHRGPRRVRAPGHGEASASRAAARVRYAVPRHTRASRNSQTDQIRTSTGTPISRPRAVTLPSNNTRSRVTDSTAIGSRAFRRRPRLDPPCTSRPRRDRGKPSPPGRLPRSARVAIRRPRASKDARPPDHGRSPPATLRQRAVPSHQAPVPVPSPQVAGPNRGPRKTCQIGRHLRTLARNSRSSRRSGHAAARAVNLSLFSRFESCTDYNQASRSAWWLTP